MEECDQFIAARFHLIRYLGADRRVRGVLWRIWLVFGVRELKPGEAELLDDRAPDSPQCLRILVEARGKLAHIVVAEERKQFSRAQSLILASRLWAAWQLFDERLGAWPRT